MTENGALGTELERSAEKRSEQELDYFFSHAYHDMKFFLKSITKNNASTFNYFGDVQKDLFYISDNMRDTFGFEGNLVEHLLTRWRDHIYGEKWKRMYDLNIDRLMNEKGETHDLRYQVMDRDGKVFWIRCFGSMQWSEDKTRPLFFSGRITRQDEKFTVDSVTGFPTADTLQRHLAERQRHGLPCVTIGFSMNHMAQINTMYGRSEGDRLISGIAKELMDALTGKMTFYRLSGIRCLAVVDSDVSESRAQLVGQIREIIRGVYKRMGFVVDDPCSFVVMPFPTDKMHPEDFQESVIALLRLAHNESEAEFLEDSDRNINRIREMSNMQMTVVQDVLNGMKNFRAVIQPVVSAETGRIVAGETLMRWHYMGRDVPPSVFIPVLEKGRMIRIAGRWILEQAVRTCAEIVKYLPEFYLTVNVSLQQLRDNNLLEFVPTMLQKYGLDGRHLVIEMTESCLDEEQSKLLDLIDQCGNLGIRLALDDFGTGYSSIRVLLQYYTSIIKLDRSLLLEMAKSRDKSNFVSSIVYACHQFGKKVCIEGVETEEQNRLVHEAQCDMIQGYYYYQPMELKEVLEIISRQ